MKYQRFHEAFDPEGPVSLEDGRWLVTEMSHGRISEISADGRSKRCVAATGRPNGLALDVAGNLWVAESRYPALLRVTMAGEVATIAEGTAGEPFLWPNDLCFGPDGMIYMTDSGLLLQEMESGDSPLRPYELPIDGRIWRINPHSGSCELLDRGLRFANGIAFGPAGEYLYVSETLTGDIFRYSLTKGGAVGARELFGNVMVKPCVEFGRVAGPDGMAFDLEGNLHVCVLEQGDTTVLDALGSVRERRSLPGTFPTNIAFDRSAPGRVLITECSQNQLLVMPTTAVGLPLFLGE